MGQESPNDLPPPPPIPPALRSRGRPKGSKNKSRTQVAPPAAEDPAKAKGRGPSFTPHEGLVLAKAWASQSSKGAYQREDSFWGEIEAFCGTHGVKRSRDSLKTQWRRMGRQCQSFIHCRAAVRVQRSAGTSGETFDDAVMNMYRQKTGRVDMNGIYQYATPFKFVEAAEFLQQQPKFVENYMKESPEEAMKFSGDVPAGVILPALEDDEHHSQPLHQSGSGDTPQDKEVDDATEHKDNDAVQVGRTSDALLVKPEGPVVVVDKERLKARPIGIKRKKEVQQSEAETSRVENLLSSMREAIDKANSLMEDSINQAKEQNDLETDIQLLQHLPKNSAEYNEVLQAVMGKRRVRRRLDKPQESEKDIGRKQGDVLTTLPPSGDVQSSERAEADANVVDVDGEDA